MPKLTKHPGVSIFRRGDRDEWVGEWLDPLTGRTVRMSLTAAGLDTAKKREWWAEDKSSKLRALKLNGPTEPAAPTVAIAAAIAQYLATCRLELRPKTLVSYSESARAFEAWATDRSITTVETLSPKHTADLRDWIVSQYRRTSKAGGKKGANTATDSSRSAATANRHLTTLSTMLRRWRATGLTPLLTRDDVTDTMRKRRTLLEKPRPLAPEVLRAILAAALKFDAKAIRTAEKRPVGVAPFTAFLMLTGCRAGEAATLEWSDVRFGAEPGVTIHAGKAKTHREREIDLSVSPALCAILAALPRRKGHDYVFGGPGPASTATVSSWRRWLVRAYGSPAFSWQELRQTCASYLCNAPGIFGAAAVFREAKQLGHSVVVAERHYAGVIRGIPAAAKSVEAAMGVEAELRAIVAAIGH